MYGVAEYAVAVQALEFVVNEIGGLLSHCDVLRPLRYEFYWLGGA